MAAIPDDILFSSSYVLGLNIEPYAITLAMEFALTPEHRLYCKPRADESECYRRGSINIRGFKKLTWEASGVRLPCHDATGEPDFGSLDEFSRVGAQWRIEGDWGVIDVLEGTLEIKYEEAVASTS